MHNHLKITYLFESTELWGGTKVALEQAELLSEAGHDVSILSKDSGPDWYPLKLPVITEKEFNASTIPSSDVIIGTYWPTVKAAYEAGAGLVVHFCQGYEGDYRELAHLKSEIDSVYSYKIPKFVVSRHLEKFLSERFGAETYFTGQMLNSDIFHPGTKEESPEDASSPNLSLKIRKFVKGFLDRKSYPLFSIIVVGPFEVDFKNIPAALKGIAIAKKIWKLPVKLIRVSQFPLGPGEKKIIRPDEYHFHVPHHKMGDIYRGSDLFVSMSKEAEGFGLPALEAMACGVPAILSRISSYCSFDKLNDYAFFADPPTPEQVAIAIKKIFSEAPLRRHLVERGLSVAGKFSREQALERLSDALGKILHAR